MKLIKDMNKVELRELLDKTKGELTELATRGDEISGADVILFEELESSHKEAREALDAIDKRAADIIAGVAGGTTSTEESSKRTGGATTHDRSRQAVTDALRGQKVLARDDSFTDWTRANGVVADEHRDASFDKWFRGAALGDWNGADLERNLNEGSTAAGQVMVPTPVATQVIDLARNKSRVIEAGVQVAPVTAQTLRLPRLIGDPGPSWRAESAAVAFNDLQFDSVTLRPRSVARGLRISRELLADAPNAGDVVAQAFADSFAAELDRAVLRGSGFDPEPQGIRTTPGITQIAWGATNGDFLTYDALLDAQGIVLANNYTPTAHILAPRGATALGKAKSSTGEYLQPPAGLVPILTTGFVPINLTTGSSSDTSEVYTADFRYVVIGLRESFGLTWLLEKFADTGEIGVIAHMRYDVQVLQPKAAVLTKGVR